MLLLWLWRYQSALVLTWGSDRTNEFPGATLAAIFTGTNIANEYDGAYHKTPTGYHA